jgi:hypothetical protein
MRTIPVVLVVVLLACGLPWGSVYAEPLLDGPLLSLTHRVFTAPAVVPVGLQLAPHTVPAGLCVDARQLGPSGELGPVLTSNCTLDSPIVLLRLVGVGMHVLQIRQGTQAPGSRTGASWHVVHIVGGDESMLRALGQVLLSVALLISLGPVLVQLQLAHASGILSARVAAWYARRHRHYRRSEP